MKLIGYFVIGNGKFGVRVYGDTFEPVDGNFTYWKDRGYRLVEVFVRGEE